MRKIRKFGRLGGRRDAVATENHRRSSLAEPPVVAPAKVAFQKQQWSDVVALLAPWLERPEATPQMFVWVSIAFREQGDLDQAETTIIAGKSNFPEASAIAVEWADIAMKRRDWAAAIARLEAFSTVQEELPPLAYVKLAIAKCDIGDFDGADRAIEQGREAHGRMRRLDVESAQVAMKAENWAEAIDRLKWVLANHEDTSAIIYLKLAVANKALGQYVAAEAAVRRGWEIHGRSEKLDTEWAQIAMTASQWTVAAQRFEWLLGHYENLGAVVYVKLAICRSKARNPFGADRAIQSGWSALGHHVDLDLEWAALAIKAKNNTEAIRRYREVTDRHGSACSPIAYLRFASVLVAEHDPEAAEEVLQAAVAAFPADARALVELSNIALRCGDFGAAVRHLEAAIARDASVEANSYGRLAHIYRRTAQPAKASDTCRRGLSQWPDDQDLLSRWAQQAMIDGDWASALHRWQDLADRFDADDTEEPTNQQRYPIPELPEMAPDLEWHHGHWHRFIDAWDSVTAGSDRPISATLYLALADVLNRIGAGDRALGILGQGQAAHPTNYRIDYKTALQTLEESRPMPGQRAGASVSVNSVSEEVIRDEIEAMQISLDSLAPIKQPEPTLQYRQFNACRDTTLELMVKGGRYFSAQVVVDRIRHQSELELWPEIPEGSIPLVQDARAMAEEFQSRFGDETDFAGPVLAEAVFRLIYAELCVREPVRRLARVIADEAGTDSVFIEVSGQPITYMSSFTPTEIGQVYLYQELYRLGVNVFFCRFLTQRSDPFAWHELGRLELKPSPVLLRNRDTTKEVDSAKAEVAVVPGNIRSVQSVVDQLANPLVYATGYIIQGFAYDRTSFQPLELSASFHPRRSLLPSFSYPYDTVAWLEASDLVGTNESSSTPLGITAPVEGDWLDWLGQMLLPSLNEMYSRCVDEVDQRHIKQAHVADNLYAESALFSAAVKSRGGSVTLWPHSANPVDVESRHPGSFDRVNAVTEAGCKAWKARFPNVEVIHTPRLMLDTPTTQPIDRDQPLSVVVLGGKNVLGLMPFVHQAQHSAVYSELFSGLEQLRENFNLRTYFKPKGLSGENEAWLDGVIDRSVTWEVVQEHPLRMALPNMLFVSVSVASSAILEGLGRGIPGLVVNDAIARDYTTIDGSSIPNGSCAEMLKIIEKCSLPGGLEELVAAEMPYYCQQTGYPPPVIDRETVKDQSRPDLANR